MNSLDSLAVAAANPQPAGPPEPEGGVGVIVAPPADLNLGALGGDLEEIPHETEVAVAAGIPPTADAPPKAEQSVKPPPKKRARTKKDHKPFNDLLYELLTFRARNGHCRVPIKTSGPLGKWVQNLRSQYLFAKNNNPNNYQNVTTQDLNPDRIAVLDSIGFVWDLARFDLDARWQSRYAELIEYKNQQGHCNAPQSTDLGRWVKMQREQYRESIMRQTGTPLPKRAKPRSCLAQDRIDKLNELGFEWRAVPPAVGWDRRYDELVEYRRMHGDCNVPQAYPANRSLGRWVMKQRCMFTLKQKGEHSQLTDERVDRLNLLGFSWGAPRFRKKPEEEEDDEQRGWMERV